MTNEELETSIKAANLWSGRSTLVLALGILGEYALLPFLEKKRWHKGAKIFFAVLVVGGIVGEYWFSARISQYADELQRKADTRAKELENANLLLQAEVLKLRAAMADRDLTPDQQTKIREACRSFSGKTVYIRSYPNDPEAARLIVVIKAALEPPLKVEDRTGELRSGGPLILGIRIDPAQNERGLAEALVETLRIDGRLSVEELSPLGTVSAVTDILVGIRPVALAEAVREQTLKRHLGPQQRKRITSKLLEFSGQKFNLFGYVSDPEIIEFANEFLAACCDKGAKWIGSISDSPVGDIVGVLILIKPDADERSKSAAAALASSLRAEGIAVVGPRISADHKAAIGVEIRDVFDPANPITVVIGKRR